MNIHLKKNPFQHDTDKDEDFANTDNTLWANNTQSIFCTSNPYVYMGLKWVMTRYLSHVTTDSAPLCIFMLFSFELVELLVEDKLILSPVLARIGGRTVPIAWHDCSRDIFILIVQLGHKHRDMLNDYWSTLEQFYMAFYSNIFSWDRFYLILRFLHFSENKIECDKTDDNYFWLWKVRIIFDLINMLNITAQLNI
jgi:hypothetical protein